MTNCLSRSHGVNLNLFKRWLTYCDSSLSDNALATTTEKKLKAIPHVQKYMTYVPKTIDHDQTVGHAKDLMKKLHVRHLPVMRDGQLIGVLTERDINLVLQFVSANPEKLKVEDACSAEPYSTGPMTPLNEVASYMAEKKIGSALIVDNGKLIGIFTEIDAFRALADIFETRLKA